MIAELHHLVIVRECVTKKARFIEPRFSLTMSYCPARFVLCECLQRQS